MPQYSGIWTEQAVMQAVGAGNWANVPGVPTGVTATVLGATSVSVAFTAPTFAGIPATITSYTVTSSPGGITASGASSPITVTGLTTGTPYTFTVTATNASGTSSPSAASSSVTPVQIDYIEDVFSTYLYTGTGATQTITNGIDLAGKGGLVWTKQRNGTNWHCWNDSARGTTQTLFSNNTNNQSNYTTGLTGFNADGYSIGSLADFNTNAATFASWTFRKQAKFFDVVTYTGTGVARTIAHSLGSVPGCIIVKCTNAAGKNWQVYHTSLGNASYINLNLTSASTSSSTIWNSTTPTSTVFSLGADGLVNDSGDQYVAYLFAHNAGGFGLTGSDNVISCGSFTADNAGGGAYAGGATVNLGYEPQFVLIKQTNSTLSDPNWIMVDTFRGYRAQETSGSDVGQQRLRANTSEAEANAGGCSWPTATGFSALQLTGGATYIYIAIRRGPMKVPTSGTSVFEPKTMSATQANLSITGVGFPPDLVINGVRSNANYGQQVTDRLRGVTKQVFTEYDSAENTTNGTAVVSLNMNGISLGADTAGTGWNAYSGYTSVKWMFGRAPSFFDEVCYTGNGTAGATQNHNLGVVPELVILKCRSAVQEWRVMCAYYNGGSSPWSYRTALNTTGGISAGSGVFNDTAPTASVFTLGNNAEVNANGSTYVAYLFATTTGVSKVGSYTGTGALQTINCGFAAGARFVLIKRTDSTGDWYTYDSARGISSSSDPYLLLNSAAAEVTGTNYVDTTSVGFQVTAAAPAGLNASGGTYIFLAIA